jgi:hypothetical protein
VENHFRIAVRVAVAGHFLQQNRARARSLFLFGNANSVPEDEYAVFAVREGKSNQGRVLGQMWNSGRGEARGYLLYQIAGVY